MCYPEQTSIKVNIFALAMNVLHLFLALQDRMQLQLFLKLKH